MIVSKEEQLTEMEDFDKIHLPCLSYSVTSIFRLFIIVRVVVDVIEYHRVGDSEVDAQATGFGGEQEYKNIWVVDELVHDFSSVKSQKKKKNTK